MLFLLGLFFLAVHSADPLFLSKYLSTPDLGQQLAQVKGIPYERASYSGYFTVKTKPFSNTFFWFFASESADPDAPVVVWLQGGPGGSSMYGVFAEHGPFSVAPNLTLVPRENRWTKMFNMLYIDNPLGVGFSFTEGDAGFVTNEYAVAQDLNNFLEQFFTIFYQYKKNPFWISGESYGGKYTPSAAYYLHQQIVAKNSTINFKGITIGDGALEPGVQFTDLGNLVYYLSMADEQEREIIHGYEARIREHVRLQQWRPAFEVFDELLNGDFYPYPTYFTNITGLSDYFNFLSPYYPPNPYPDFLSTPATRQALHVGDHVYWDYNATVERYLIEDWMKPVTATLPVLFENYRCLIYNGQNDVILGGPLTMEVLRNIPWKGRNQFDQTKKLIWHSPEDAKAKTVSGYVLAYEGLTHVVVRDAGHLVPADQPERAFDMINRFILNKPWS